MYKLLMTSRKQIKFAPNFLCLFFGCLVWLFSSARPFFDVQKNITLDFNNLPVKQVFKELNSKTGLKFIYSPNDIDDSKRISMTFKDQPIKVVLDRIFSTLKASYTINDNTIIIKRYARQATAQEERVVVGRVVNQRQIALARATVSSGQGKNTTSTDEDGQFTLKLDRQDSYFIVSLVGYVSQRVALKASGDYTVVLADSVSALDEVVVVGFGTQRRASVVGAITTIEPKRLQIGTSRSMSNNLAGQLAGIIAVQRSGEPGYDNSNFWIRGISTFGGSRSPLILVDGVERSLDNMDPEEIESFSILKDAAASAVYGVRGANGVILINTKRGKVGKPSVSARFEQGITSPIQLPKFVGAADYLEIMNSIREERGEQGLYSKERIENIRNQTDPDLYPDVNWLDAVLRDRAGNSRGNVSVNGGSDILRYSLVTSYYREGGLIERDEKQAWNSSSRLNRYNVRSNVDINVSPTTLFRLNIGGYLQDRTRAPQSVDDLFQEAFTIPPYVHPTIYSSGEIPRTPQRTNPWALATQRGYERISASKIESLFAVEQDLSFWLKGLKARGLFSFDRYSNTSVVRSKSPDYYNPAIGRDENGKLQLVIDSYGQEFLGYEKNSDWGDKSMYLEGAINYTQSFGNHNVEGMFLYNQRNYDNGDLLPYRNQGIASRFSYNYNNRYIAEFNFGYNGSENFAPGKRYGFFPSFALGWYISEEPFMEQLKSTISKLKLRGSYGLVGNDKLDGRRFAYITTINETGGYSWGLNNDFKRAGRMEGDQGNSNLTWETVAKSNIGVELGLWRALEFQLDLFNENREDIFMQRRSIPGSSGFTNAPWANFGRVNNKGIDMSLELNKQLNPNLFLSVRSTFTYARNKILEQDEPIAVVGSTRSSTGRPIGQLFGFIDEGLFTDADFSDVSNGTLRPDIPRHTFGPVRPGDIRYRDLNNDGVVDALDRTAIGGTEDPQIVFGFGSNLRYKAIDFGFFFQGISRTYRIIGGSNFIPGSANGAMGNIFDNVSDRWTVSNPSQDVFYPRLSDYQSANNNLASTWWLRDMSFVRLRNVEVGYSLPPKLLDHLSIRNFRIFLRGNNLLTISDFKLWDPELGSNNGMRYPIMKSVSMGLELNFK
ncbi:SusC/RagA family TonB-linked outer membrane protein [Sphingobacterium sp. DR205]|uniref:SusC/RagA family TonB-linked outer membrane protein n=1 Tax=Sphingobacterium sp. DR205 TaxID=2713573 RepID=UPI0013E4CD55|nr:SusC/RagA family TonB-linked outer membrane protein [Sphingobacterium sp. DR205]QIH32798.1 SusC/RagA family TonB-linked outer membrane protein [Sphingobacterium sp. DR205]